MFRNTLLICFLVTIGACQKEMSGPTDQNAEQNPNILAGADRTDKPLESAPVYENYPGVCKISMRIYYSPAFNDNQPVQAHIRIRGSNINGSSTIFDYEAYIHNQNHWIEFTIPESAYLFITLLDVNVPFGETDYIKIQTGEFGFNKRQILGTSNPFGFFPNVEQPVYVDKFPPFNNDYRYECAPWCTWTMRYEVGGDPLTQDGPTVAFRGTFAGQSSTIKTFSLSPATMGLKKIYPLSSSSLSPMIYQCQAYEPPTSVPPFCYDLLSQDNTVYPPQNPAPIPPSLMDITYGLTPPMICDSYCKMNPKGLEYPHCPE